MSLYGIYFDNKLNITKIINDIQAHFVYELKCRPPTKTLIQANDKVTTRSWGSMFSVSPARRRRNPLFIAPKESLNP
jgi:hypothetical protein